MNTVCLRSSDISWHSSSSLVSLTEVSHRSEGQESHDEEPTPPIDRLRTDRFRSQTAYSPALKRRLAQAKGEGLPALRALADTLVPFEQAEDGVLVDLLLSYRALSAWQEMIELVEALPEPVRSALIVREQYGFALNRAGRDADAELVLRAAVQEHGPSSETLSLLGRVHKDRWEAARGASPERAREYLDEAIDAYHRGFKADPRDAYPGINTLTLMEIRDPGGSEQQRLLPAVRDANRVRLEGGEADYWDRATALELAVIERAREPALAAATAALASVREAWEPESTAGNLALLREARAARGERLQWAERIERELRAAAIGVTRRRAQEIADGAQADLQTVREIATHLRAARCVQPVAAMLIALARRALYGERAPGHGDQEPGGREDRELGRHVELAELLSEHQQFGYARRLFGRARALDAESGEPDPERLRQRHAFCTYKDMELPVVRRLERALEILGGEAELEHSTNAETLGLAGAVCKRKWEVGARRADLERSLGYYERGLEHAANEQERAYTAINAAFVSDQLAALERQTHGAAARAAAEALSDRAQGLRRGLADELRGGDGEWLDAVLAEAHFGLGDFERACRHLAAVRARWEGNLWRLETIATQLAALAHLREHAPADTARVLETLMDGGEGALGRATAGKVGLALSGGGFRAALFHVGVLARLAERGLLRHVEVLSCVSGGSIVGAFYYLKLRRLLQTKEDGEIVDGDYLEIVHALAVELLDGVRQNLRGRLATDPAATWKMLSSHYSRTDRAGELFQELFFARVANDARAEGGPWRMTDLLVEPFEQEGFSLRYENWSRAAKVPMLVINATSLNTGHNWQFTASWMGEPPSGLDELLDASRRLRRMYYRDAPPEHRELLLGKAVAASACVPGLFPPVTLRRLYKDSVDGPTDVADGTIDAEGSLDVELVDGGVHDNQGVASLLEQDCTVILVSDASGQIRDDGHPGRRLLGVANRSNSILMSRVRGAQYSELASRLRSQTLRGLMFVHLKKGLPARPRDWRGCEEPYVPSDDALAPADERPDYGIAEPVQRALAELRTDLDAFSDDEAHALMAAGYAMTERELERPELDRVLPVADLVDGSAAGPVDGPAADPVDVQSGRPTAWPFAPMLTRLREHRDDERLAQVLEDGRHRFFRRLRAWRARRARGRG
jgi:predicted acylesterase/phospholipase RssA